MVLSSIFVRDIQHSNMCQPTYPVKDNSFANVLHVRS